MILPPSPDSVAANQLVGSARILELVAPFDIHIRIVV